MSLDSPVSSMNRNQAIATDYNRDATVETQLVRTMSVPLRIGSMKRPASSFVTFPGIGMRGAGRAWDWGDWWSCLNR